MSNPVPEGFRSLMYCDELSCGGAMDVVRIQLQPSDVGLIAAAQQNSNVVSADVLVGADGIARGIRIVR
jgi:2-polyprenyl-6-methoxyphenol hydroxylase-like FAD-dependent oxidoreductase